jgi:hypothetical protein
VVVLSAAAAILISQPTSASQRRAQFHAMAATLRSDLAACDNRAAAAVSAWQKRVKSSGGGRQLAQATAKAAAVACNPSTGNGIFNLTLYAVPTTLSKLRLNYAVSCLGVWAQEDVQPAMLAIQDLLRQPADQAEATAYRRASGFAASNLASANLVLQHAARKLGITDFTPLQLTSLTMTGLVQPK